MNRRFFFFFDPACIGGRPLFVRPAFNGIQATIRGFTVSYLSIYLSICLSVCLSLFLSLSLSLSLSRSGVVDLQVAWWAWRTSRGPPPSARTSAAPTPPSARRPPTERSEPGTSKRSPVAERVSVFPRCDFLT